MRLTDDLVLFADTNAPVKNYVLLHEGTDQDIELTSYDLAKLVITAIEVLAPNDSTLQAEIRARQSRPTMGEWADGTERIMRGDPS